MKWSVGGRIFKFKWQLEVILHHTFASLKIRGPNNYSKDADMFHHPFIYLVKFPLLFYAFIPSGSGELEIIWNSKGLTWAVVKTHPKQENDTPRNLTNVSRIWQSWKSKGDRSIYIYNLPKLYQVYVWIWLIYNVCLFLVFLCKHVSPFSQTHPSFFKKAYWT